jgi:hypothetical protein
VGETRWEDLRGIGCTVEDIRQILLQKLDGCKRVDVVAEREDTVDLRIQGDWQLAECADVQGQAVSLLKRVAPAHVGFDVQAVPQVMWESGAYQAREQAKAVVDAVGEMQWVAAYELLRELQVHVIARMEDRGDLKAAVQRNPGALEAKEQILVARPALEVVEEGRAVELVKGPVVDVDYVSAPGSEPVFVRIGRSVYACAISAMQMDMRAPPERLRQTGDRGTVLRRAPQSGYAITLTLQTIHEVDDDVPYRKRGAREADG